MSVIYTPENRTIANRDITKLSSNLLPIISFLVFRTTNIASAHDFVVRSNTADLAIANINVNQVSFYLFPTISCTVPFGDTSSVLCGSLVSNYPDLTIHTDTYINYVSTMHFHRITITPWLIH